MNDFVTVKTFTRRTEAEMAKGLLATNGINSLIMADDAGGMGPYPMAYTFGVELKVVEKDAVKARKILKIRTVLK